MRFETRREKWLFVGCMVQGCLLVAALVYFVVGHIRARERELLDSDMAYFTSSEGKLIGFQEALELARSVAAKEVGESDL